MTETQQPVLRVKRRLPSGRAVLGGLLVSLAVVAVLVASRVGEDATFQDVVIAQQELAPGTVIEAEHVQQIRMRLADDCLLYTSPSPRDLSTSRMPSSA